MYKRHGALWLVLMHKGIWEWRMPQILGDLKFSVSSVISFLIRWWVECYLRRSDELWPKHGTPWDYNQVASEARVKNQVDKH